MNEKFLIQDFIIKYLPKRQQESHKGTYGAVLNIAGSTNYRGAAFLSSVSALKTGCGYVTLACPLTVATSVSSLTPDIVLLPLKENNGSIAKDEFKKVLKILPNYQVLSLGCGLSSMFGSQKNIELFVKDFLEQANFIKIPTIIDADGLNIISKLKIKNLPQNTILTPHPKELAKLLAIEVEKIQSDRIKYAQIAAKEYNSIVVLKGHKSVITDGVRTFVNTTGNSALAKAGSGDVLTGIIAGLAAQGLETFESAFCGVYIHGLVGEMASEELSEYSVNASDLIDFIPKVMKKLSINS